MSLTNSSVESTQLREKKINELKGKSIQITYLETKGEKSNEKEKKKNKIKNLTQKSASKSCILIYVQSEFQKEKRE